MAWVPLGKVTTFPHGTGGTGGTGEGDGDGAPLVSGASFFRVRTTTRVTTASIPPIIKNSSGLAFYSNVQTKN